MLMPPWFEHTFQRLVTRHAANRLHHGLLLTGQSGIGKMLLAQTLAKTLLCKSANKAGFCGACQSCQLFDAQTHPDYSELVSDKQLGVDKIREGIGRLSATSQLSGNKVLIIPRADMMTESAANALLKTLEEPTANTFLILVTDRMHRLLPTIISRCEKHVLSRPHQEVALAWLSEQGLTDVNAALLEAYAGAPLRVQAALEDNAAGISYPSYQEGLEQLLSGTADAVTLATEWQASAATIVDWLQQYAHQTFIQYNSPAFFKLYKTCIHAHQALQNPGVNKIMILSGVLAEIKRPASSV
ncbi:DNA polymerase III subunit delta' [Salinimonas sp. HHU 13199]|uniref:DNA-directed DNA polymerase n=1 Tax=Salinimonas profundi TaxID=2729140 RepID=A0ABR8LER0_9ALTE|nr:DNA polymerase III subunit delta' [Salinimonas profundi]MBD3584770.1 DNA polymerase III subunit delta' [Salinimonas profundi]